MALQKNEELDLKIVDWGDKGLGAGYVDDALVLVPFSVPGDTWRVLITKVAKDCAYAKPLERLTASDKGCESRCGVFGRCGGCQLQHVRYDAQLDYKVQIVREFFEFEDVSLPEINVVGTDTPYEYRNKVQFSVAQHKDGSYMIGLSAPRSQRIIDTDECPIQLPVVADVIARFRDYLNAVNPTIFDGKRGRAGVSHLIVRTATTGDVMVAVGGNVAALPGVDVLLEKLTSIPGLKSVLYDQNDNPEWESIGGEEIVLWGDGFISESISGKSFQLSLASFFQGNPIQLPKLWEEIKLAMSDKKDIVLWDLFCGSAAIGIALSDHVKQVVGIETNGACIADARANLARNNVTNYELIDGDVGQCLGGDLPRCDVAVVDPPRKGLSPLLVSQIVAFAPPVLVYVSCAPATLARDVASFVAKGYVVDRVSVVDMFAQTYHVETVVRLSKAH